jgi:hypothetical protein
MPIFQSPESREEDGSTPKLAQHPAQDSASTLNLDWTPGQLSACLFPRNLDGLTPSTQGLAPTSRAL